MSKYNDMMTKNLGAFVDELSRQGLRKVVMSPGSRSTPLVMLFSQHPKIELFIQVDERSAAYFALGMAKASKFPVALVCTSGTAVANYLPAMVEAKYSRVPLLVLSGDRPYELQDVGAPQAIDQKEIFGKYSKWFLEMPLPEENENVCGYFRTIAARAVTTAFSAPAGGVHLNFPFREPLIPNLNLNDIWGVGNRKDKPSLNVTEGARKISAKCLEELAFYLENKAKGFIICGPGVNDGLKEHILALAEKLNYPILADPLSQLRVGKHSKEMVLDSYGAFLRGGKIKKRLIPEVVIRFGAMPVSKSLFVFLKENPGIRQIIIDEVPGWKDPTLLAKDMVFADPHEFCVDLARKIGRKTNETYWLKKWKEINALTREIMQSGANKETLFEGRIFKELRELLPERSCLFVSNSMPVRDLDSFFQNTDKEIQIHANRGANGIDGVTSTALGASVYYQPTVLVIGDLSFFHDLNGLMSISMNKLNITIVLVNNDGGGIFSFLPQAKKCRDFEKLFATPLGLDYENAARLYGGNYQRVENWEEFKKAVEDSLNEEGLKVIEVPTNREDNYCMHQEIWVNIKESTKEFLSGEWDD